VGGAVGAFAGKDIAEVVGLIGLAAVLAIIAVPFDAIILAAKTGLLEKIAEDQVDASGGQARARGLAGPTHSELSKDAPSHQLFDASTALAAEADREIGKAMLAAWASTPAPAAASGSATGGAPAPAPAAVGGGGADGGMATATAPATAPTFTPEQEAVAALVDKYVCNPAQQSWWEPVIKAEAAKAGP
jgi:hypothetical protein